MWKLVVSLVLLATHVYCQVKPCCFPDQWEATEGMVSGSVDRHGHSAITLTNNALSMDADAKRVHLIVTVEVAGSTPMTRTYLELYQQKVQYIIQNTTCIRFPLESWDNPNCMPDTASLVRRYRLGLNESMEVADFTWGGDSVTVMGVTEIECVPVSLQFFSRAQDGMGGMGWAGFLRPTLGIKDPTIFAIPDICKGPAVIDSKLPRRGSAFFTR